MNTTHTSTRTPQPARGQGAHHFTLEKEESIQNKGMVYSSFVACLSRRMTMDHAPFVRRRGLYCTVCYFRCLLFRCILVACVIHGMKNQGGDSFPSGLGGDDHHGGARRRKHAHRPGRFRYKTPSSQSFDFSLLRRGLGLQ